jgi:hypothetical protein
MRSQLSSSFKNQSRQRSLSRAERIHIDGDQKETPFLFSFPKIEVLMKQSQTPLSRPQVTLSVQDFKPIETTFNILNPATSIRAS